MFPHKEKLWLKIVMYVRVCVYVLCGWLQLEYRFGPKSKESSEIVLSLLILKMAGEKFWAIISSSPKVRNLS